MLTATVNTLAPVQVVQISSPATDGERYHADQQHYLTLSKPVSLQL